MKAFNYLLEPSMLRPREVSILHKVRHCVMDRRCVRSRLENQVLAWLALSNNTQTQSPTLGMPQPISACRRMGLCVEGTVEVGWRVSSILVSGKK